MYILFRYTFQIRVDFCVLLHNSGHQYILFYFLFQIMVNKKHGKQNRKKVWNLRKASLLV